MNKEDHNETRDVSRDAARGTTPKMNLTMMKPLLEKEYQDLYTEQEDYLSGGKTPSREKAGDIAEQLDQLRKVRRAQQRADSAKAFSFMNPNLRDNDVALKIAEHYKRIKRM